MLCPGKKSNNQYTKNGQFPRGKNIPRICGTCDKEFFIYPSALARGEGKYCSLDCVYKSTQWRGTQSNRKKESPTKYWMGKKRNPGTPANYNDRYMTAAWKSRRLEIYKRDKWTCQECGKQTSVKFGKDRICCHHIDYNHKNLANENLITLCWSCHAKTNGNRPFWTSRFSMERN